MNDMTFELPRKRREPVFFMPAIVIVFIVVLLAIYFVTSLLGGETLARIDFDWGFIPGRFTATVAPGWIANLVARSGSDPDALTSARLLRETLAFSDGWRPQTLATYAFLHGSWTHVGFNCVWLAAFGPPVARRFGWARFTLFFLCAAVAGALAHWLWSPYEAIPMIGASAADSGLMAAAARFIFRPGAAQSPSARASSLREMLTDRRSLLFIGIWMATNFLFGAGAGVLGASEAPVAWVAHVGGFLCGLLLFGPFDRAWR
jgi:membrane associated rhomboid family serine protease